MNQTNNRIREEFEKEVPAYSMNEYRMEGDIIRPLMVQKEDAWNFMLSKIDELLKSQREVYKDALIWCSGSEDFQIEGKAREGWEKICLPLIKEE